MVFPLQQAPYEKTRRTKEAGCSLRHIVHALCAVISCIMSVQVLQASQLSTAASVHTVCVHIKQAQQALPLVLN